jgi:MFS family permease
VLLSAFSLGGLISSPVADRVVDRVGPSDGLRLVAVASIVGALATALAGRTWWILAAAVLVTGAERGFGPPATNLWISQVVPTHRRGLAFGINQSAAPLAGVLPFSLVL